MTRKHGVDKVGHAGTLDPLASGVLVVCVGSATRLSDYVMHTTKRYQAHVVLGTRTDTYDAEGRVTSQTPADHITQADVEALLPRFTGQIAQVPPSYSALKQGGKKLYEMARAGEEVTLQPRPVTIERLQVLSWQAGAFVLDVVCGAGTYIRSLAHDIGNALGVGAHLGGLVRVASGAFTLERAIALDDLLAQDDAWQAHLIAPLDALAHYPQVHLSAQEAQDIRHGRAIVARAEAGDSLSLGVTEAGELLALLQSDGELLKPHKVFLS
jgi:tRNA pseudouridine55 synthase